MTDKEQENDMKEKFRRLNKMERLKKLWEQDKLTISKQTAEIEQLELALADSKDHEAVLRKESAHWKVVAEKLAWRIQGYQMENRGCEAIEVIIKKAERDVRDGH